MSNNYVTDGTNLTKFIQQIVTDYCAGVTDKMAAIVKKIAKETRDDVKQKAKQIPVGNKEPYAHIGLRKTNQYINSWTFKEAYRGHWDIRYMVYAKSPHYRLTHLLEYGHEKWLWGVHKVGERVPKYEHIGPAEKEMEKKYLNEIEVAIRHYDI